MIKVLITAILEELFNGYNYIAPAGSKVRIYSAVSSFIIESEA